jgi:HNH endonuclease
MFTVADVEALCWALNALSRRRRRRRRRYSKLSISSIRRTRDDGGVVKDGIVTMPNGDRYRAGKRMWSPLETQAMRDLYPYVWSTTIAAVLGRPLCSVHGYARKLGIRKTAEFVAMKRAEEAGRLTAAGVPHRYQKGQAPLNKGLRRPGWSSGRMKETQFKKGVVTNWCPVGYECVKKGGYRWRKVSDIRDVPWTRNWRQVHHIVWTDAGRTIPPGYRLGFVNGDKSDIRLENLQLVTARQLMARNTVHNLPRALRQTIHALGALNRQIHRRERAHAEA